MDDSLYDFYSSKDIINEEYMNVFGNLDNPNLDTITDYIQLLLKPVYNYLKSYDLTEFKQKLSKLSLGQHISDYLLINIPFEVRTNQAEYFSYNIKYTILYFINKILMDAKKSIETGIAIFQQREKITVNDIFISIFNEDDLRFMIFKVCPDPFPSTPVDDRNVFGITEKLGRYHITDLDSRKVVAKLVNYLCALYQDNLSECNDYLYNTLNIPSIVPDFTLGTNEVDNLVRLLAISLLINIDYKISNNEGWRRDKAMFYIASLYDNDYIQLKDTLSQKYL